MTDTNDMIDIAQAELEQLVGKDASSITEAEKTVVREDRVQAHGPGVEKTFMTQVA